jgi:Protein of unknown function (DUF3313)
MNDATAAGRRLRSAALLFAALLVLAGCASVPLRSGGTLKSYDRLGQENGLLGKSRTYADMPALASARTVRILPAAFSPEATARIASPVDRSLVTRALDRAVCVALSDRYQVVAPNQPADLTVRSSVIDVLPTDKTMAGLSTAASLGSSFVLPVGVPRIPLGLGGIAIEGEVTDHAATQRAAIVWARGANSFTENPRYSEVGDAYSLAAAYGDDFADLILRGTNPSPLDVSLPSLQRIGAFFGGQPRYPACDTFGRAPGLPGLVAGMVGAPPEWTDRPPQPQQ